MTRFAVLDFETTGLCAARHDRVVEIGIVRLTRDFSFIDEFTTLVNPERDVGATRIHGIRSRDVIDAPCFHEIAGDILDLLQGHIIVAHNANFDMSFLKTEFQRVGLSLPQIPYLCTIHLSRALGPGWMPSNLAGCCAATGIEYEEAHCALADARATAELFRILQSTSATDANLDLLRGQLESAWQIDGSFLQRTGRVWHRQQAAQEASQPCPHLSKLVYRVAGTIRQHDTQSGVAEYLDVLHRVLEDRVITADETETLYEIAKLWQLRPESIVEAHRLYLRRLASAALADGIVSDSEFADLKAVAQLFGFDSAFLSETLEAARNLSASLKPVAKSLRGQSVCFTGECGCTVDGAQLTRDRVHALAANAGLTVKCSVTKNLDILVVSDPYSQSGKAKKARDYGIRILHEPVFWQLIGVTTD